jgi:hypothetical protein
LNWSEITLRFEGNFRYKSIWSVVIIWTEAYRADKSGVRFKYSRVVTVAHVGMAAAESPPQPTVGPENNEIFQEKLSEEKTRDYTYFILNCELNTSI